jgi:PAS domain S-box-containing protein
MRADLIPFVLRQATGFIGICDETLRFVFLNKAGRELVGLPADEDIEKYKLLDFFVARNRSTVDKIALPALARQGSWEGELCFYHFAEATRQIDVLCSAFALHDEDGDRVGMALIASDISTRKRADRKLRDREEWLNSILQQLPHGVGIYDRNGALVQGNDQLKRYVGSQTLPSRDPEALSRWQGFSAEGRRLEPQNYPGARALRGEHVVPGHEFLHTADDGSQRWTRVSAVPFRDDTGAIQGAVVAVEDIDHIKRAAGRLERNEARLRAASDLVGLGVYSWDPQTDSLEWDTRLLAMWGLPPGTLADRALFESAIHPDDLTRVREAIETTVGAEGDGRYALEYRVIGIGDGVERWIATAGQAKFRNDRATEFIGAAVDITERKHAEERLQASEERLRLALAAGQMGTWEWDSEAGLMTADPVYQSFFDLPPQEQPMPAEIYWTRMAPEGIPIGLDAANFTLEQGASFQMEQRVLRSDGSVTWLLSRGRAKHGDPKQMIGISMDISERRRSEEEVRASEERFRQFTKYSGDVLWILNLDSMRLEYLSPAFEQVWGMPPEAMLRNTRGLSSTIHPEDRDRAASRFEQIRDGGTAVQEFRIIRPDGAVRWVRETVFPIRGKRGKVRRAGGITQDVTRHTDSLVYAVDADRDRLKDLARILQGGSHDVKVFSSPESFLEVAPALRPGVVLLAVQSPGAHELAILQEVQTRGIGHQVVALGATGDVGLAVRSMRAGAVDWLEWPFSSRTLLRAVATAIADLQTRARAEHKSDFARARVAEMSDRERQVLDGLLAGGTNKMIARDLGLSPRTVELHRARAMERLGARTLTEAVLIATAAGLQPVLRSAPQP